MTPERVGEPKTDPAPSPPPELVTLRRGSHGELVGLVQNFLRGLDVYHGPVDEDFGPGTDEAVRVYQRRRILHVDGVVGNMTWGSMMTDGLVILPSDAHHDDRDGPNWPPPPVGMPALSSAQRAAAFGAIEVIPAPMQGNPEGVQIVKRAPEYRIITTEIPALLGVPGFPASAQVFFHARVARQLQLLFGAWRDAGLLGRIHGWGGSLSVRFVRGSRSVLSAHAWGTAFDINVQQNPLGAQPALAGRFGSVRELVPIANEMGFFWGGHFKRSDGMHFEVARVL